MECELKYLLLNQCNKDEPPSLINDVHTVEHLAKLKNGKAADLYGITAEHLKLASPILIPILTTIINRTLKDQRMPIQFKSGVITPIHKPGKPVKDPNSYRRMDHS